MTIHLDYCLALQRAHASVQLKLDDALGTFHGISFSDFVLLDLLAQTTNGKQRMDALVRPLGQRLPLVLRQLITLEKIGLIGREGSRAQRYAVLRPAGRALRNLARETAGDICSAAFAAADMAPPEKVCDSLLALSLTSALALS